MRVSISSVLVCLLVQLTGCGSPEPGASDSDGRGTLSGAAGKPNVVVILIDTLRADYLGAYGHEPETAPFLNRVAEDSTVFTRAFSTSSWTAPSTASLFTGTYPTEHGIAMGMHANRSLNEVLELRGEVSIRLNRLRSETVTLPEYFQDAGYRTFGVASNGNVREALGFTDGFDAFSALYGNPAERLYEKVREMNLGEPAAEPYLLYVHLNDVHTPYLEREPYFGNLAGDATGERRQYLSEIGYVDAYLEKMYDALNMDENTVLVIVSDHGEEFLDHGFTKHGPRLYNELNRIVMMFHASSLGISSQRLDVNVSIVDVLSTLLDLCEISYGEEFQGRSLAPLLGGGAAGAALSDTLKDRTVFSHRVEMLRPEREHWAAMFQHWKLYEPWGKPSELYDHRVDFAEKHNVFSEYGEVAGMLTERLAAFKKTARDHSDTSLDLPIDRELFESLETLGYVD